MNSDSIDYAALIDEAMHIIVKKSLQIVVDNKLPGDHHFFISFLTNFPGVILSDKLKKRYPTEMTIVLQYQFEELEVNEKEFSVTLSFDNMREKILIPFIALTAFADPSVKFGLQFRHLEENYSNQDENDNTDPISKALPSAPLMPEKKKLALKKSPQNQTASNVITLDQFRRKSDK